MSTPIKQGDILAGDIVRRIDQYESSGNGFHTGGKTVTTFELVERPAPLPTAWGTYSDKVGDIWTLDEDGLTRICDHETRAANYAPFERMLSADRIADNLAVVRDDIAESGDCTTTNIERARRNVAYLIDTLTD